ncbi:MAG: trypsin-like peptidase domain-containing protein [Cyclobacteriaceae bacterium]|nr:trypsin-like peptidase domain-containing protein [Cyclobacteriaceae bacterium]
MRHFILVVIVAFGSGLAGAYTYCKFYFDNTVESSLDSIRMYASRTSNTTPPAPLSEAPSDPAPSSSVRSEAEPVDFSVAAARTVPSVVYINSISKGISYSYWDWFFGDGQSRTQVSTGSGVIFTTDGYIITNNHVVQSAERLEVIYNKRSYPATLIGTDPSTDLAVLKIDAQNLPAITLGSSETLQVGEWVIAVGNPFSLSSTVTAGIVSAKGRRIGILEDRFPIESFIQTDAAINPGNSGGALVNKSGELAGINSAILSRTGSYTGYAFAIPVDIVKKVYADLVKYGVVQRAIFGARAIEYNYENARKYNIKSSDIPFDGVLLESLDRDGPAVRANLKPGDIITRIDDTPISTQSAFEEKLSYHYPGDKITVHYIRDGKAQRTVVTLVNKNGTTDLIRRHIVSSDELGAQLEATDYGVKVFQMRDNSILKRIGVPENFTIVAINRVRVKEPKEVIDFFERYRGRGYIYGINSQGQQVELNFALR